MLDGEQFLQELRTINAVYTLYDDELFTVSANSSDLGRIFVYLHLKQLPWTLGKIDKIYRAFEEIFREMRNRGVFEVYSLLRIPGGERIAPFFDFYHIADIYNDKGEKLMVYKREL